MTSLTDITARAFTLAESAYSLFNADCPKAPNPESAFATSEFGSVKRSCSLASSYPRSHLHHDIGEISEDSYLAALADHRQDHEKCSEQQIKVLLDDPKNLNEFASTMNSRLALLAKERRQMDRLSATGLKDADSKILYRLAKARMEEIRSSMPFKDVAPIAKMIEAYSSQLELADDADPKTKTELTKSLKTGIQQTLEHALQKVGQDRKDLQTHAADLGRNMPTDLRESLAQDVDLIESYHRTQTLGAKTLKSVACRVDAKYSSGAKIRDTAVTAALTIATMGAAGLEVTLGRLAASATTVAADGAISTRAATALRIYSTEAAALGAATSAVLTIDQVAHSCYSQSSYFSGKLDKKNGNGSITYQSAPKPGVLRCEKNILVSLREDTCVLDIALGSLDAIALLHVGKKIGTEVLAVRDQQRAERLTEQRSQRRRFNEVLDRAERERRQAEADRVPDFVVRSKPKAEMTAAEKLQHERTAKSWQSYSDEFVSFGQQAYERNSQLIIRELKAGNPHFDFLKKLGYKFEVIDGKLKVTIPPLDVVLERYHQLQKENVLAGRSVAEDILVPRRAFILKPGDKKVYFRFGDEIPPGAVPFDDLLKDSEYIATLRENTMILGEARTYLKNGFSALEHDMAHISGYQQHPDYQAEIRNFNATTREPGGVLENIWMPRSHYVNETMELVGKSNRAPLLDVFAKHGLTSESLTSGKIMSVSDMETAVGKMSDSQVRNLISELEDRRHALVDQFGGASRDTISRNYEIDRTQLRRGNQNSARRYTENPMGRLLGAIEIGTDEISKKKLAELLASLENTSHFDGDDVVRQLAERKLDRNSPLYIYLCENRLTGYDTMAFCN